MIEMKKVGVAVLIMMTLSAMFITPAKPDVTNYFTVIRSYWGVDQPIEVSPSDVATLSVIVRYEFGYSGKSIKADLHLPEGFRAVGGSNQAETYFTGAVSYGSIITLQFPIFITQAAGKGGFTTYLELNYYQPDLSRWRNEILDVYFEVTGKPIIDAVALNTTVVTGNQMILIALSNKGDGIADNLKLAKVSSSTASAELPERTAFGMLQPGQNVTVPVHLYIPINLSSYQTLTLQTSCVGPSNVFYSFSETLVLTLAPTTPVSPIFLSFKPTELVIGQNSRVTIGLKNIGDYNVSRLRLSLTPDSVLKIYGASEFYIDSLRSKESTQVDVDLYVPSTTTVSTSTLTMTIVYFDDSLGVFQSDEQRLNMLLRVNPSTLISPLTLSLETRELLVGKSSKVYIEAANNGSSKLSGIKLSLSSDAGMRIFGNTTLYFDSLIPGETKHVNTEIYVPSTTTATTAVMSVAMTYLDEKLGIVRTDSQQLSMLLRGLIDLSLTDVAVIPSPATSGRPFSVTLTVTNVGTTGAAAAYAIPVMEGLPVRPLGPRSVYIGSIDLNLPTAFTLNLQLDNTTQRAITLPVVLNYMDNLRTLYNVTLSVPISIVQQSTSPQPVTQPGLTLLSPIVLLAIAAVIVIVIVLVLRRRRKQE